MPLNNSTYTIIAALLSVASVNEATGIGVTDTIIERTPTSAIEKSWAAESLDNNFRRNASAKSPAAKTEYLPFSVTSLYLEGSLSETEQTLLAEFGKGKLVGSVNASSYRHIGNYTTVWGHAQFHAGRIKDVIWNNSADYELVGPYVIGDPVGGDLTRRSYDFGGGYAGESNHWSWGVEASYRALIDYRGRDPRDKIIVSDLNVAVGGSFRPTRSSLAVGLAGDVRVYNQTAAIEFYNPMNDIPTYAMTGLGSYYPRFSGNSGRNTAYSGVGFNISASLFPQIETTTPISGLIEFSNIKLRQYMRDFNNLELTNTSTTSFGAEYAMIFGRERETNLSYGFKLRGDYRQKVGTENLLGTSTGNNYPIIGERENYRKTISGILLILPIEWRINHLNRLNLSVGGEYHSVTEKLNVPFRKISTNNFTPSVNIDWMRRFSKGAILTINGNISHRFTSPKTISLNGLELSDGIGQAVERNVALITSDITTYGIMTKVEFPIVDSASLYIKGSWQRRDFSQRCGSADYASLSFGINI